MRKQSGNLRCAEAQFSGRRLEELDSIRGIAALTVVVCHFVSWWYAYADPSRLTGVLAKMAHPLYAGPEAVRLFFVLSGMVLAASFGYGRQSQSYRVFLLRRFARIYIPYLVALALSVAGAMIWHGDPRGGVVNKLCWSEPVRLVDVLRHIPLIGTYDPGRFNLVFWSLTHELRISILFPLLFLLIESCSNLVSLAIAIGCTMLAELMLRLFDLPIDQVSPVLTVHFIFLFILGMLIARNLGQISEWYAALRTRTRVYVLAGSLVLYGYGALGVNALIGDHPHIAFGVADWVTAAGAAGIIITAHCSAAARKLLNHTPLLLLGRVSYTIYLVHLPLLFMLMFVLQETGWMRIEVMAALYLLLTSLIVWVFYRLVEVPSAAFGRRVGRKVQPASSWFWTQFVGQ